MSQSSPAPVPLGADQTAVEPTTLETDDAVETVLAALDDDASRAILEATSDEARTANELSKACDLPLSTAYRKLELLTETGMLAERTRLSRSGKHASEYVRLVEEVSVSLDQSGEIALRLVPRVAVGSLGYGLQRAEP